VSLAGGNHRACAQQEPTATLFHPNRHRERMRKGEGILVVKLAVNSFTAVQEQLGRV
jgi:hypothetical protein